MARHLTLYHAPESRSGAIRCLLEELGASYELRVLDLKNKEQREPGYLAVNPMGETVMATPAISDGTLFIRGARHLFAIRRP